MIRYNFVLYVNFMELVLKNGMFYSIIYIVWAESGCVILEISARCRGKDKFLIDEVYE